MNKVAHYLQEHLLGEVSVSPEVRRHFARDGSIFELLPQVVIYPKNEDDVRKTARFGWQLAERGRSLGITARGGGSDTSGAALGAGIMLVFTAHMNKLLKLDPKNGLAVVEPGITYAALAQTLHSHSWFLPPYPQSQQYATLGGGLANNASGEKSVKYGATLNYVRQLRVVLANGDVIETRRLNKRELSHKMGLASPEGEIYRAVDTLLEENDAVIQRASERLKSKRRATGYNIFDVRGPDGGLDLTPLIIGSQGTLGLITEASLDLLPHSQQTHLSLVSLDNSNDLEKVLPAILELKPSAVEMINKVALDQVRADNPNYFSGLDVPAGEIHLLVEFDDLKAADQKEAAKKLEAIATRAGAEYRAAESAADQDKLWQIRHSVAVIMTHPHGQAKAVPVAEDVSVPVDRLTEFLHQAAKIYKASGLVPAVWGRAGDGVVLMQPVLNIGNLGDRQKLFRISEELYDLAIELGGAISGGHNDGRQRGPYLKKMFGEEVYGLMEKVKQIFDPHSVLNPGVKLGVSLDDAKALLGSDYHHGSRHQHLPRS